MPKIITKTGTPRSSDAATYVIGEIRPAASYIYLADGTKVQAIGKTGQGYEYVGSLRLSVNGSSVDVESIPFAGGRIVKTSNGYEPQYYITDHLGSTRTVVKPKATVVAEFDYMPYGTQHAVAGAPIAEADYKYTGKEQQTAFGLDNLYDSQARFQYVTDGSFMSHDPLSATFSDTSPYMYCGGDPINAVDMNGEMPQWVIGLLAGIGGGALYGIGELIDQVWNNGFNVNWDAVGGAVAQGAIVSTVAVASVGNPMAIQAANIAVANMVGGEINRNIQGQETETSNIVVDAVTGAGIGVIGGQSLPGNLINTKQEVTKPVRRTTYQTYTKTNTKTGQVYSGRTSGTGSPRENVSRRDKYHHKNKEGYGQAELDKSSSDYNAIRGREQWLIEKHGGAQSQGGTSGNAINGISRRNRKRIEYLNACDKEFNK